MIYEVKKKKSVMKRNTKQKETIVCNFAFVKEILYTLK